ncbi:MAG: 30S ribosomal protein S9 [Fidelibacterota bacterium]
MKEEFVTVGRRKASVVRLVMRPGTGKFEINTRGIKDFFDRECHYIEAISPLVIVEMVDKFDIKVNANGGGQTGQAGAVRLALARALVEYDESLRGKLKTAGLLTRDSRMKERKKYGMAGARRGYQFSKR